MRRTVLPLLMFAAFCLGCGDQADSNQRPEPIPTVPAHSAGKVAASAEGKQNRPASSELKFDGIRFTLPAGWKQVAIPPEKQGFIDAQLLVPAKGEELTVTLSSIGGGIDANVARWRSQFVSSPDSPAVIDTLDVGGRKATWVDLRGEFRSSVGMARTPQSNQRMLGVGIPLEPRDFYLKLVGPFEAVEEIRDEFRTFVQSAQVSP